MSRSIKKTPICKSRRNLYRKFMKRQANKKVRQSNDLITGKYYRKIYQSCMIYDYVSYYSLNERIISYRHEYSYNHTRFKSEDEAIQDWKRFNYYK